MFVVTIVIETIIYIVSVPIPVPLFDQPMRGKNVVETETRDNVKTFWNLFIQTDSMRLRTVALMMEDEEEEGLRVHGF